MSQIAVSSIPVWARPAAPIGGDLPEVSGRSFLLIGVGDAALVEITRWKGVLPDDVDHQVLTFTEPDRAASALRTELSDARVGLRVIIIGSVGAALALRGVAVSAGLEDDEIYVTTTEVGDIEVFCTHCRDVTATSSSVGDTVICAGCGRDLLIYHHVSRRSGRYLGYLVDAETAVLPRESAS
ncbi:dimethylamine monooxygenase subunit DmmA family protein [Gordonia hankookensis]|uniref:Dimethylamine monooxygenase subunit DmmA-like C-terminal domain-containing protein n=1 Tax=Gordonia hankookensis TaxID=589403 RepID=A0ABR7WBB6_9ACTN|nr:dimethylamine monooxygenase subunit DmmA family protein [Gordonia hankookensis]MBD1320096.1 hypothetical protein [Gordonia hankookensis]